MTLPDEIASQRRNVRTTRALTGLALVGAALLLAVPSSPRGRGDVATSGVPTPPPIDAKAVHPVVAILTPPQHGPDPVQSKLVDQIVALGDSALPVVIGILCGEVDVPEFADGTVSEPVHPRAIEMREAVLRAVLRKTQPARAVAVLAEHVDAHSPLDQRLAVAQLLGDVDSPAAVDAILAIARTVEPLHLERSYVQVRIEGALCQRLEFAPRAGTTLRNAFNSQNAVIWPALARVASRAHSPDASGFLVSMLGRDAELDVIALQALAERCERLGAALSSEQLAVLRNLLDRQDARVERTALAVLGRLRDREAVPAMIAALTHESELVAQAAHGALRTLAQTDFGATPAGWDVWIEHESSWFEHNEEKLDEELASSDAAKVYEGARSWLEHPLFAREAAAAFAKLVTHADEHVAEIGIDSLKRLGCAHSIRGLSLALEREDELRDRAAEALRALTGLDLPADPKAWRQAIEFEN